jgi:multidrug efflux pump subunit AcrA (membrane-fusion protein)
MFCIDIELKRDVACEVVSSSLRVHAGNGLVSDVYVRPGQAVKHGQSLLAIVRIPAAANESSRGIASEANSPGGFGHPETIVSPRDGKVLFVNSRVGQTLEQRDVAVLLDTEPDDALQIVLRVPSAARSFVHANQPVSIKLDAFPYATLGSRDARIESLSQATVAYAGASGKLAEEGIIGGADDDYLAWASLRQDSLRRDGRELQILPGMRGKASIAVGRVTIAEWLLAPLLHKVGG